MKLSSRPKGIASPVRTVTAHRSYTEKMAAGPAKALAARARNTHNSENTGPVSRATCEPPPESIGLIRRILLWTGLSTAAVALMLLVSCDYSAPESMTPASDSSPGSFPATEPLTAGEPVSSPQRGEEERTAILGSSITLIQRAAIQPGGDNFKLAIQKLNHYFEGTSPSEYQLDSAAREFLRAQMPETMINEIENRNWSLKDARHIEDCMMYYGIASRVAGTGDALTQVRRVFDWAVKQTMLVPPGALDPAGCPTCTPARTTCSCAAWLPRPKAPGLSAPGCSSHFAGNWVSTREWSHTARTIRSSFRFPDIRSTTTSRPHCLAFGRGPSRRSSGHAQS